MIASLEGALTETLIDGAVITVGGVGYRLYMPASVVAALPEAGSTVRVLTHLYVREDQMTLYGFETGEQRDLFTVLLGVSGIGPKAGLAALSVWTPEAFRKAVATEDIEALTLIPGVGKKTAARMILELREKLGMPDADGLPGEPARRAVLAEVKQALENLGYSAKEARDALEKVAETPGTVEEVLVVALKEMGS